MQRPPTSMLTPDPLYCSYSAQLVILACKSASKDGSSSRCYIASNCQHVSTRLATHRQSHDRRASVGNQSQAMGSPLEALAFGSKAERVGWAGGPQGQRHHLHLPQALPQGNLGRYFDLACITSGLRCLSGYLDAWQDAWQVLQHALANLHIEGMPYGRKENKRVPCQAGIQGSSCWTQSLLWYSAIGCMTRLQSAFRSLSQPIVPVNQPYFRSYYSDHAMQHEAAQCIVIWPKKGVHQLVCTACQGLTARYSSSECPSTCCSP